MPKPGNVKIRMNENFGGFLAGDIREVSQEVAEPLVIPPQVPRGEKPIPAKAELLKPGHPQYDDVPGPKADPTIQMVPVQLVPANTFVAPAAAKGKNAGKPSEETEA